jgi:hypothetical protein
MQGSHTNIAQLTKASPPSRLMPVAQRVFEVRNHYGARLPYASGNLGRKTADGFARQELSY